MALICATTPKKPHNPPRWVVSPRKEHEDLAYNELNWGATLPGRALGLARRAS